MKTGKELKMNRFKDYNVVFGSVNNKNPKAIYINISAWAEPLKEEDVNYNRVIKDLHKKIKQVIYNHLYSKPDTDFIKENTIVDLDIRESGIKYGKRSFMSCEVTLYLHTEVAANSERMKMNLDDLTPIIIKSVFDNDKNFKFHRKKQ
ncbi:MAG: hypothetical protein E6R13_05885 [Spirochaetes bacterium]|nr:MAG: hypothetical protein E6R13_05885 [Spirochaetota bacterium]